MTASTTYNQLVNDLKSFHERGSSTNDSEYFSQLENFINRAERRLVVDTKLQGILTFVGTNINRGGNVLAKPSLWRQTASIDLKYPSKVFMVVTRSSSGFIRTLTTAKAHAMVAGDTIIVSNIDGTNYDGQYTILSATQKTLTYTHSVFLTESSTAVAAGYATGSLNQSRPLFHRSLEYCRITTPIDQYGVPKYYADYDADHFLFAPNIPYTMAVEVGYYANPAFLSSSNQTNWLTDNTPDMLLFATLEEASLFLKDNERAAVWGGKYKERIDSYTKEDIEKVADRNSRRRRP